MNKEYKISEMLEQLTEKLKAKGCHFLADIEFSDNSEWISGEFSYFCFIFINCYFYLRVVSETFQCENSVTIVVYQ